MDDRLLKLALLASGGAAGTVARYALSVWAEEIWQRQGGSNYPVGTTIVNLLGSLAFGLAWVWTAHITHGSEWRLFLTSGVMGAFTTFSTLMFEATEGASNGRLSMAVVHVSVHVALGAGAIALGLTLGRLLFEAR